MTFRVEVIFNLEVEAANADEAALIVDDMRIKHPQTAKTLALGRGRFSHQCQTSQ